jgi:antitoxin component YwqK of YwqJK toxin-antitoxin module
LKYATNHIQQRWQQAKKTRMKNIILILLLTLSSIISFGQNEKILYIVDSIPVIEEPKEGFGTLTENEIDNVVVVKDKKVIASSGYKDLDGIIYVFTKEYTKRPDSIKTIPTTKSMTKKNGAWYLRNSSSTYSGKFIDYYLIGKKQGEGILFNGKLKGKRLLYHLNGNVSDEVEYDNGINNGLEKRFYKDGILMQKGSFKNGSETGVWQMYHPNGKLKQKTTYNENGKIDGESISFYSTEKVKVSYQYKNGIYQKNKTYDKIYKYYNEGQKYFKTGDYKTAIKKYSKCIELDASQADSYFARGTAKMEMMEFDEAINDFNKVLEIEPYYTFAYANRGIAILRKYEFKNSRTIKKIEGIQIIASRETEIPETELIKMCKDLNKAVSLGDNNRMVLEALEKHCKK